MVTRNEVRELVDACGKQLEILPYAELSRLADLDEDDSNLSREHRGAGASVWTSTAVTKIEGKRERIAVEVFVSGEDPDRWAWKPCYYVEVYPSGKVDRFDRFGWRDVAFWLFVIAGICGIGFFVLEILT